ncbi:heme ABC exporter ATP-binding protein CcmA [Stenotrophomonas maltophilia]|uniref:heme ABC exporter ATP-binding protein CcmA n=1 Tax=Stenotrophomonas maltophilia TaxID=40324 RepID=UPI003CCFEA5E
MKIVVPTLGSLVFSCIGLGCGGTGLRVYAIRASVVPAAGQHPWDDLRRRVASGGRRPALPSAFTATIAIALRHEDPCPLNTPALLAASGLSFSRNDEPVFGPLDFHVDAGEALLVQGGNGAGKTTLLRVLAGLARPGAGQVRIDGKPASNAERARYVAYLSHLPALKPDLDTLENLHFLCGLHGRRARQMPGNALAIVGLAGYEDTLVRHLSAGQKRRLALARIWLSPAPLWLLDEPYANLDLEGITLVNRMISAHLRAGGAALVTTHGAYAAPPVRTRQLDLGGAA